MALIEALDLAAGTWGALKRAGIDTVEQLAALSHDDLCKIRNLGKTRVAEVECLLKSYLQTHAIELRAADDSAAAGGAVMTNGDCIRSMINANLAEMLCNCMDCDWCKVNIQKMHPTEDCYDGHAALRNWLAQPAESGMTP